MEWPNGMAKWNGGGDCEDLTYRRLSFRRYAFQAARLDTAKLLG